MRPRGDPPLAGDASSGLSVAVWERDVRIGLLAEQALPDAERLFGLVQQLARSITERIGWIAYDPAQRVALRPTDGSVTV
ncbi:hypothetical protein GS884_08415 [Rhodococcus hoagii]|nr:hypothetical protein [Prescottella equi]